MLLPQNARFFSNLLDYYSIPDNCGIRQNIQHPLVCPMMNTSCSTQYLTTLASGRPDHTTFTGLPHDEHCLLYSIPDNIIRQTIHQPLVRPVMNTACSTQYLTTVASGRPYNIHRLPHDEHCLLYSIPDNCGIRQTIQHPLVCPMMNTACSTQYLTTYSGRPYNIHCLPHDEHCLL